MAMLTRVHHLSLTVTDLTRSRDWYRDVLGFEVWSEVEQPTFRRIRMRQPGTDLVLTLTCHRDGSGDRFDERRTGMDHVCFAAGTVGEVSALGKRFDELGVEHSPIRPGEGTAVIVLRDPDNIQVEVFGSDA